GEDMRERCATIPGCIDYGSCSARSVRRASSRRPMRSVTEIVGPDICSRCIMDTSDPEIFFDDARVCNHCHDYDRLRSARYHPNSRGEALLRELVADITRAGAGNDYDAVAGVSGGVDSTFLLWKAKQLGLRLLAVHVDCGWDAELAVHNIEHSVKTLGI